MVRRFVVWRGLEEWAAESARVELGDDGLRATGTQFGADPLPYRADYALDATGPGFTTRHLRVAVAGDGWRRTLDLLRDDDGGWSCAADGEGAVDLPAPGGDLAALAPGARDCDLARSPLTNLMPVRRHALHREPGVEELRVAWVSLPDLAVHVAPQRYAHVRAGVVHFSDPDGFSAEIEVDDDGLVRRYPRIAERV
jgi:hypothetical protein